jgi:hypothetical protein
VEGINFSLSASTPYQLLLLISFFSFVLPLPLLLPLPLPDFEEDGHASKFHSSTPFTNFQQCINLKSLPLFLSLYKMRAACSMSTTFV